MKILRHILSHLFLIFFLVAIVSVFYYRTLLLPNDVVEKVDGIVTEIYPPALKFVSKRDYFWSIAGERIVSFDDLKIFEKNNEVISENKTEDVIKIETSIKPSTKTIDVVENEVEPDSKVEKEEVVVIANVGEAEATKESIAQPDVANETIVELPKENNKIEDIPVAVKDSDTSSERDLLINARNAFIQGETIKSEKFYLELTQLDNDNPDIFGELGNVYYSQGKWSKAGQAYYDAAERLISEGNYEQVTYLQQVINGLSPEYAEKLSQRMLRR